MTGRLGPRAATSRDEALAAAAALLGERARRDVPLGPLTTYRVGGRAALLVVATSVDDLLAVAAAVAATAVPTLVVGKGSNLLVAEAGFPGLAVTLGAGFAEVATVGTTVRAGGSAALPVVARRTVRAGLTGFEWAVGVPGSVGGAVRMNAGGHGSDVAASLVRVRLVDLRTGADEQVPAARLGLGYRRSEVGPAQVVVEATLELAEGDRRAGEEALAEIVAWRRANQPGGQNAGSVFTNPPGDSAGRLIDVAGGKGLQVGSARVSTKHANFFQVEPGGSADDVVELMRRVRRLVRDRTGVDLRPETRLVGVGWDDEPRPLPEAEA
ncbi:MAG TPA: UDP-N-acetylmuramate dehydrogenase [Acidimicrobiales bacterium]|nr:UDP-N-acetylmuramate dehydrogenase [Acidimicrobiales bacterium]